MSITDFANQLDYFARHYIVAHPQAVTEAFAGGTSLPPRALMPSLDDDLKEHYTVAHVALRAKGWAAVFFAPVASTINRNLLMVHKIHLILSRSPDRATPAGEFETMIDAQPRAQGLRPAAEHYVAVAQQGRYDEPDTVFTK